MQEAQIEVVGEEVHLEVEEEVHPEVEVEEEEDILTKPVINSNNNKCNMYQKQIKVKMNTMINMEMSIMIITKKIIMEKNNHLQMFNRINLNHKYTKSHKAIEK